MPAQTGQPPPNGTTGLPPDGAEPLPNSTVTSGQLSNSSLTRAQQAFVQEGTILGAQNPNVFSENKLNLTLGKVESGEWKPDEFNRYVSGLEQWNKFSPQDSQAIYNAQLRDYTQQGRSNAAQLAEADVAQARGFLISGGGQLVPSDLVKRYPDLKSLDLDAIRNAFGNDPLLSPDLRGPVGEEVVAQAQLAVLKGLATPSDIQRDIKSQLEINKFTIPMRESFHDIVLKGFGKKPNAAALTDQRLEQALGIIRATEGSVDAADVMAFAKAGFFNTRAGQMGFAEDFTPLGYVNDYSLWVPVNKPPMGQESMVFSLDAQEGTHTLGVLSPAGEFYNLRGQFNGPTSDKFAPLPNIPGTEIPSGVYEKSNPENAFKYSEEEQKKLVERAAAQGLPGKLTFKTLSNGKLVEQSYVYDELIAKLKSDPAGFNAAADKFMYSVGLRENVIVNNRLGSPIETVNGEQFRQKYLQPDYPTKALDELIKAQGPGNIVDQFMADVGPGINGFFKSVDLALGQVPSGIAKMVDSGGKFLTESNDPNLKGLAAAGQLVENFTMTQWMQDMLHHREHNWSSWDIFDTGVQAVMWMGPALIGKFVGVNMRTGRALSNEIYDIKKELGSILKLDIAPFSPATNTLKRMAGTSTGQSLLKNRAISTLGTKAVLPVAHGVDKFADKFAHITDKWGAGTEFQKSLNKVLGDPGKEVTTTQADRMVHEFLKPMYLNGGWENVARTIHSAAKILHVPPRIADVALAVDQRVAVRADKFIGKAGAHKPDEVPSSKEGVDSAKQGDTGKEILEPKGGVVEKGVGGEKRVIDKDGVDQTGKPPDEKVGTFHSESGRGIGESFATDTEVDQIFQLLGRKVVSWNSESSAMSKLGGGEMKQAPRTMPEENLPTKMDTKAGKEAGKEGDDAIGSREWLTELSADAWINYAKQWKSNRNWNRGQNGASKATSDAPLKGGLPFGKNGLGDDAAENGSKGSSIPKEGIWEWGGRQTSEFKDWAKRNWRPIDQHTASSQYQWVRRAAKTLPQSYVIGVGIMGGFQVADNIFSRRNVFDRKNYRLRDLALAGGLSMGYSVFSRNMLVPFMERLPIHLKERVEPYYPMVAERRPDLFLREKDSVNDFILDSKGMLQPKNRIELTGHDPSLPWYKGNWNEHMNKEIGIQANIAGGLFTLGQYGHDPYSNGMKLAGPFAIGLERYWKVFRRASGYSLAKSYHLGDWMQRNLTHLSKAEAAQLGVKPRTGIPFAGSVASLLKWAKRPPGQRIGESKKDFKQRMKDPEARKKYQEDLLRYGDDHKFWAFGPNYVLMANVGVDLQHYGMPALGALPEEARKKREELEEERKDYLEEQLRRRGEMEDENIKLFPPLLSPNLIRR